MLKKPETPIGRAIVILDKTIGLVRHSLYDSDNFTGFMTEGWRQWANEPGLNLELQTSLLDSLPRVADKAKNDLVIAEKARHDFLEVNCQKMLAGEAEEVWIDELGGSDSFWKTFRNIDEMKIRVKIVEGMLASIGAVVGGSKQQAAIAMKAAIQIREIFTRGVR